jgi:hypothetical protein
MNLHNWLAAVFVLLVLAGCVQMATEQGRSPYDSNMRQGGDGGGGGM